MNAKSAQLRGRPLKVGSQEFRVMPLCRRDISEVNQFYISAVRLCGTAGVKKRSEDAVVNRKMSLTVDCLLPSSLKADGEVADAKAWRGSFCCKQSKPH